MEERGEEEAFYVYSSSEASVEKVAYPVLSKEVGVNQDTL